MSLTNFVRESNYIEGIIREPQAAELAIYEKLLHSRHLSIDLLEEFVSTVQPGAALRDRIGMNVMVGTFYPPPGGPHIRSELEQLLASATPDASEPDIFQTHHRYENLHPFMDGNGRSGRLLWLWMMGGFAPRGFLHEWYYQSLRARLSHGNQPLAHLKK